MDSGSVSSGSSDIFIAYHDTQQPVKNLSQIAPLESNSMDIGKQLKYHNAFLLGLSSVIFSLALIWLNILLTQTISPC